MAGLPVPANSAGVLSAQLDSNQIPVGDVARYHCHDRDYPAIQCFKTEDERDADAGLSDSSDSSSLPLTDSAVFYVTFYEHWSYAGSSYSASVPTAHLGAIGWNDAISSFKSLNGQRPMWWEHTYYTGSVWQWPAGSWVSYVGNVANDRFSSVKNVP